MIKTCSANGQRHTATLNYEISTVWVMKPRTTPQKLLNCSWDRKRTLELKSCKVRDNDNYVDFNIFVKWGCLKWIKCTYGWLLNSGLCWPTLYVRQQEKGASLIPPQIQFRYRSPSDFLLAFHLQITPVKTHHWPASGNRVLYCRLLNLSFFCV